MSYQPCPLFAYLVIETFVDGLFLERAVDIAAIITDGFRTAGQGIGELLRFKGMDLFAIQLSLDDGEDILVKQVVIKSIAAHDDDIVLFDLDIEYLVQVTLASYIPPSPTWHFLPVHPWVDRAS